MSHAPRRPASTKPVEWAAFAGVLFDLDGVLTPTADVHERAWTETFDGYIARTEGLPHPTTPFEHTDYLRFVDGKPRFDGVRSFLASRGIVLPDGSADDPPGDSTVCAVGNRKNQIFGEVLERDGMRPFPGSVAVLDHLDELAVPKAVVSSSRNTPTVLRVSGLAPRFHVVVDGNVAAERHIPGKPAPDMFLVAADELGVTPDRAVVVEDALSGVAAGRAGGFALVIGVDRGAGAAALLANGADVVVADLSDTLSHGEAPT